MLAEDRTRLQKIDALYALRLDQFVSLPQLVVVGDQSSGKSSVLEGLTGLPFPRDSGLCTRFPTQIVFKRSTSESKVVSIMAIHGQNKSRADAIAKFGKRPLTSFDERDFSELLAEASECMGITLVGKQENSDLNSFSHNILKFELSGPEYENFSVVDLPGIFRKPTPGQTRKEDIPLVREMISKYLSNPRSIILAVVPANVDIATQEIIQMAEDADPNGQRTLGVLTKPDLVDRGAEQKVMELLENRDGRTHFDLGYTIVCNRSQSDLSISNQERNARETTFFNSQPWSAIPKERAGIKALKHRLDKLLVEVTRQNFQAVAVDVQVRIHDLEKELNDLGPARQTPNDQRNHLTRIAVEFRDISTKAIDAHYNRDPCFREDVFRLATNVMAMNTAFSDTIELKGCTRKFRQSSSSAAAIQHDKKVENAPDDLDSSSAESLKTPGSPDSKSNDYFRDYRELKSLTGQSKAEPRRGNTSIMRWIKENHERSKGFEVGTIHPSLLPSLFLEQSRGWEYFARQHVEAVIRTIHMFNHKALFYCGKDALLSQRLWSRLSQLLLPKYRRALDHVSFLVQVEQDGHPMTMNHYFADNLRKAREDRIRLQLIGLQSWTTNDVQKEPLLRLKDTIATFVSNDGQSAEDLHDILEAYYKVARKRFVDAVCLQAVDHFLISNKQGPLWLFSPQYIGNMTDTELNEIAGEGNEAVSRRRRLMEEIESLKAGQKILAE
ncbi:P-loop containing nucleoside triphosphate hydrolase protein [Cadophora sp. MPI-SDFR-AT-0126]|nr:P-loop containing nucleoside triphosphate hydrolase protein [Leotiomycetes sp. MPI-SDFR-AT-0126]